MHLCYARGFRFKLLMMSLLLLLLFIHMKGFAETLHALLEQGNLAAQSEQYDTAIKHYRQAHQLKPNDRVIRKNMTILYINAGVHAQSQKEYSKALKSFWTARDLMPDEPSIQKSIKESIAGTYFSQAMDLREVPDATTGHYSYGRVRDTLQKARDIWPENPTFSKALANVYMDEAYPLAMDGHLEESRVLLEEALHVDPDNKTVKGSLANIYIGLAQKSPAKQQELTQKALELDSSPRILQAATKISVAAKPASQQTSYADQKLAGFSVQPHDVAPAVPRHLSKLSVHQMLTDLENQLGIEPDKDDDLEDRVNTVEKKIYGKRKEGPLAVRAKTVYTDLMGSYEGSLSQSNPHLEQAPVFQQKDNYLAEIFKVTDGKVIRWGKFPLRVYFVPPAGELTGYQEAFKTAALKGFKVWEEATQGFVNSIEIQDPELADVTVHWQQNYEDRFEEPTDSTSKLYKTYMPPKKTKLKSLIQVATMVTPGYFSLAPQAINAAMQYQQFKKLSAIRHESSIELGLALAKGLPAQTAMVLIQNMAAKEFGHVLGLKGVSDTPGDLLYPELRSDVYQLPSQRDLNTLSNLYKRPPNIILNVR